MYNFAGKYAVVSVDYLLDKHFTLQINYGGISQRLASEGIAIETLTAQQLRDIIIDIRREKLQ